MISEAPKLPDWGKDVNDLGADMWWSLGKSGSVFSIYQSPITGLYVLCHAGKCLKHDRLSDAQQEAVDLDAAAMEKINEEGGNDA